MMTIVVSLLIILTTVVGFVYLSAAKVAGLVVHPPLATRDSDLKKMKEAGFDPEAFLKSLPAGESFECTSFDGTVLSGTVYRTGEKGVCVFCHGWNGNSFEMTKYGPYYRNMGFSLVFYDHRYSGENAGRGVLCTMGQNESRDLVCICNHVKTLFPPGTKLVLHGESMGASCVLMAAPYIENLCFCVSDCAYSSMRREIIHLIRARKVPVYPIINLTSLILKLRYKVDMNSVEPVRSVSGIECPVLFIHGEGDSFVPFTMAGELYEAKKTGVRELEMFDNPYHAVTVLRFPEEYGKKLETFAEKNCFDE